MRKNKMMRLASALLVAVLLSTCAISGTFAKYVTTASAADTARVAKWGVAINSVNAADNTFFKGEYTTDDTKYSATITNSVDSADGADVIAPGTKGDWVNVSVSGTPEVAVKVEYAADLELEGWILGDHTTFYCPVIIIIDGVEYSAAGTGCTTADAFEAYIEAKIAAHTESFAPNQNLSDASVNTLTISWKWNFESGDDSADTYYGNLAAAGQAPTISLTVTTTVTQID